MILQSINGRWSGAGNSGHQIIRFLSMIPDLDFSVSTSRGKVLRVQDKTQDAVFVRLGYSFENVAIREPPDNERAVCASRHDDIVHKAELQTQDTPLVALERPLNETLRLNLPGSNTLVG